MGDPAWSQSAAPQAIGLCGLRKVRRPTLMRLLVKKRSLTIKLRSFLTAKEPRILTIQDHAINVSTCETLSRSLGPWLQDLSLTLTNTSMAPEIAAIVQAPHLQRLGLDMTVDSDSMQALGRTVEDCAGLQTLRVWNTVGMNGNDNDNAVIDWLFATRFPPQLQNLSVKSIALMRNATKPEEEIGSHGITNLHFYSCVLHPFTFSL